MFVPVLGAFFGVGTQSVKVSMAAVGKACIWPCPWRRGVRARWAGSHMRVSHLLEYLATFRVWTTHSARTARVR